MLPRVSIIIPVYNVEKYVEECLLSVANQTVWQDIECIVVDDRGNDNSMEVVKDFIDSLILDKQKIFRTVTREKNGGLSAARNSGIKEAKGEYLYFLDSDDCLLPNAIEILLSLADKYGGVDLLPALYKRDDDSMERYGKESFPEFSDNQREIKHAILDFDRIPDTAANRLIRREFLLEHNLFFKEGIIHEDNYWTFFLAKHVKRMAFCPEKIYYYRITEGSITRKINKEKEALAFKTIITDSANNIDDFEKGAEKRLTFFNLMVMWNGGYFESKEEANELVALFLKHNTLIERFIVYIVLHVKPHGFFYNKCVNLLQRIYLLQK